MTDRRSFLGRAGAVLAGSFLIRDPQRLIVPEQKIVLATEVPLEPLGHVLFDWAEVKVRDWGAKGVAVNIHGYVDELERTQAFYLASEHNERLKIYFTGIP